MTHTVKHIRDLAEAATSRGPSEITRFLRAILCAERKTLATALKDNTREMRQDYILAAIVALEDSLETHSVPGELGESAFRTTFRSLADWKCGFTPNSTGRTAYVRADIPTHPIIRLADKCVEWKALSRTSEYAVVWEEFDEAFRCAVHVASSALLLSALADSLTRQQHNMIFRVIANPDSVQNPIPVYGTSKHFVLRALRENLCVWEDRHYTPDSPFQGLIGEYYS